MLNSLRIIDVGRSADQETNLKRRFRIYSSGAIDKNHMIIERGPISGPIKQFTDASSK